MARRRTELEKAQPEAGGDPFTPFAEVFTASATVEDPVAHDRAAQSPAADPEGILSEPRTPGTSRRSSPLRPGRGCPG